MMARIAFTSFYFSLILTLGSQALAKDFLVVIDPGHGGSDFGAVAFANSRSHSEKEMTLLLSREIANELQKKNINAVLTRKKDLDISLPERTALANRLGAKLFISVHMNSSPVKTRSFASGIETYILNNSTNESSIRLASLENKVLEGSIAEQPDQSPVSLIVKDLMLDANLKESKNIACRIQSKLVSRLASPGKRSLIDRGVKQALFYVLLGADMPSILLEAGFLDHPDDRHRVENKTQRKRMARGIAEAIDQYRSQKGTKIASRILSKCQVH